MNFNVLRVEPEVLKVMADALFQEDTQEYEILVASAMYIEALERLVFMLGSG